MTYAVASLRCEADSHPLEKWLAGAAGWAVIDERLDLPPCHVRWEHAADATPPPDSQARWRMGPVGGGLVHARPSFVIPGGGTLVESPALVRVFGTPDPDDAAWRALLTATVFELLASAGYLSVHGALLSVGARGILVMGPPGAGKSTLVFHASTAGARYSADDLALLWQRDGRWHGRGVTSTIRLFDPSASDGAFARTGEVDESGKQFLRPSAAVRAPVVRLAALALLDPNHDGTTRAGRLDADAARVRALEHIALALTPTAAAAQLGNLPALLSLPCWDIHTGRDMLANPDIVTAALDRIARAAPGAL